MPEREMLAANLKEARKALDMDQFEFACEIGISKEEVSLLELEKTDPKLSTLQKIAAYLGKAPYELIKYD